MYSVFRNHVTCGIGVGVEVPEAPPAGVYEPDIEAGSSKRSWSFGSSFGGFWGSGLSSKNIKWFGQNIILGREYAQNTSEAHNDANTHQGHRRPLPINKPTSLDLMAYRTPHPQS